MRRIENFGHAAIDGDRNAQARGRVQRNRDFTRITSRFPLKVGLLAMTIEAEIRQLPNLKHIGLALVEFVYSLQKGSFKKKKSEWVYDPNFVAFTIRYKRAEKIHLHISTYPTEIEDRTILPLYAGRWPDYMRCEITSARQLACAARYIEASYSEWHRGIFGT